MEGFNGDGNDGHRFNDDGSASGLGGGFNSGYGVGGLNSGYGDAALNSGFGDGGHTRDFLSQPPSFSASGAHTSAGAPPPGFPSSSNPTPSQLRLDSLDLNGRQSWADMHAYQGILQSGGQDGGSGSFAPPLLCACLHSAAGVHWAFDRLVGPLAAVVPVPSLLVNVAPHLAALAAPGAAVLHATARNQLPTTTCLLLKSRYRSIPRTRLSNCHD